MASERNVNSSFLILNPSTIIFKMKNYYKLVSAFVSTASPQRHAYTTADDLTLAETLMEIRKSAAKAKGKAKMDETESPRKMKQREQGFTDAECDDVLARVVADEDFVQQLQADEKCSEEDLPMKLVELVNQRKKFFAQHRAEAKRNKPITPAQQKEYMSNYIKNQEGGYSIKQLKSLSFEQVKEIFETTMRKVQSFVPMGSELEVQRLKRAGQEVLEEPVKRQKIGEASGSGEESAEKEKELSEEELQKLLVIVPVEEVYVEALQVKYPIIDWEVYSEDTRRYWKIIRVGNHTEAYQIFAEMLKKFDRDDLVKLWDLVKERFSTTEPTDDKEKELWVELKRLFEPDNDDTLWKLQRYMHDPLVWRLYDTCGVHHVSSVRGHEIFMLVEKEYPLTRGLMTGSTSGIRACSETLNKKNSNSTQDLEYDLWSMRMEQYLNFIDHALWEVIVNGDSVSPVASASTGAEGPIPPKTAEQKIARKNELKAKSTLMLAIPDEHLLKFHACKDAKSIWEAIKNSQLEIHGEVISQEDANLKLVRSLPSAWNNIALIMRNKFDLDTLSMDDLYNNLKVYESEIKGKSSSSSNSQNVAFVSFDNSSSTNEIVNTAHSIFAASSKDQASTASYADDVMFSFFSNQSNAPQLDYEDLEQIDADDLEEMDLKWQVKS
ncbi:hypothetical protein Tco_1507185 [Tanacetum coccineum]